MLFTWTVHPGRAGPPTVSRVPAPSSSPVASSPLANRWRLRQCVGGRVGLRCFPGDGQGGVEGLSAGIGVGADLTDLLGMLRAEIFPVGTCFHVRLLEELARVHGRLALTADRLDRGLPGFLRRVSGGARDAGLRLRGV